MRQLVGPMGPAQRIHQFRVLRLPGRLSFAGGFPMDECSQRKQTRSHRNCGSRFGRNCYGYTERVCCEQVIRVIAIDHADNQEIPVLRHDDRLHPAVRELLRVPAFVVDGLDSAIWTFGLIRLSDR